MLPAAVLFVGVWVGGCSQPGNRVSIPPEVVRGSGELTAFQPDQNTNIIVATIDGEPIRVMDLWPAIAEGGGAGVLQEVVLDRRLSRMMESHGSPIGVEEIEHERRMLLAAISDEVGADEALSDQALARVRSARGLGPARFAALLRRTAIMRALVQPEVAVSEEEVAAEVELLTGVRARAIVAVFSSEQEAAEVRAGLVGDTNGRLARLSALARSRSIDPSASSGGVVGPIHPRDPRVPASLRSILEAQPVGEMSPVLATDDGFAILLVESRTPAQVASPEHEIGARDSIRRRKERVAMEALARRILAEASVNVIDASLRWSWRRARGMGGT